MNVLPPHGARQRIGLLGGSFHPAHKGHQLISLIALKRLKLDAVWWLITPGNPLKDTKHLAPLKQRMKQARHIASHPRIRISDFEATLNTRYTVDTLRIVRARCPATRFIWLMGADNLMTFHHWKQWHTIAHLMPIAVIDRPRFTLKSMHSRAAIALKKHRVSSSALFSNNRALPRWTFIHAQRSTLSSTALRLQKKGIS
jgi:nicotinate-nucleotide adenylyltransferase